MRIADVLPTGFLIPESILDTELFQILATFVALNSVMYATLALLKVLPRGYAIFRFDGRNRRRHNRSIYPDLEPRRVAGLPDAAQSPAVAAAAEPSVPDELQPEAVGTDAQPAAAGVQR